MDDRRAAQRAAALALLETLEASAPRGAHRVGLTGAPGAGKSTLLDAITRTLRAQERSVGVVAVDPSSQRSGGALLGDRFRVRSGARDPGVFFRSMAARDRLGGLADATRASVLVLGAVFDVVFVETVGVGQSESDVSHLADTLVYVAQPGAGDVLQFMKAGILELPDVFAVNKADVGSEAIRTAHELEAGLGLGEGHGDGWGAPVLQVSAREGTGVEALVATLDDHRTHLERSGELALRRRRGDEAWLIESLSLRYGSYGLATLGGPAGVRARLAEPGAPERHPARWMLELGREIEQALAKGNSA